MRRSASWLLVALLVAAVLATAALRHGDAVQPPSGAELAVLAQPPTAPPLATDRIYFVMTDRYANGDAANNRGGRKGGRDVTGYDPTSTAYFHGGDFKGLTGTCTDPHAGLARIKSLGFNAIWVTPPFGQNTVQGDSAGYHGYWIDDFTHVDPHLGTDADFGAFVDCAHSLGLKVFLDVVVNHTGDVIQLAGTGYNAKPYRDCHGKVFDPVRFVASSAFPCLSAATMPRRPVVAPAIKKPDWLNDVTNYHDRGDLSLSGACDETCLEQGDFFGLDDLFTEKPAVLNGLAQIYSGWIARYKLDGFRVDTARHVNAAFFGLWTPKILAAARAAGVPDFQIFGEVSSPDTLQLSTFVRDRGLPNVLDFPLQAAAVGYVAERVDASQLAQRFVQDDYFRLPDGVDPAPATFLGNHDMGRAAFQIASAGVGAGSDLLARVLLGYDLLYLMRGAPVVYYGDEVGMIGSGGDQAAREDMLPTQVAEWKTEQRVGGPPIGSGSSLYVTNDPIEARLRELSALREANPALATGATTVRYAKGALIALSRVDVAAKREYLELFNNGSKAATLRVKTATPSTGWTPVFGGGAAVSSDAAGTLRVTVPGVSALVLHADADIPAAAAAKPRLFVHADSASTYWQVRAAVSGTAPVSIAFAVRRAGSATWQRLDVDDSAPYRAFLDPRSFGKDERVSLVAIARSLDGRTAVSAVVPFRVRTR
ncbi:MAG: alpha-amylase family glycosyl hydrolase [Gaiellaceae bacterium]